MTGRIRNPEQVQDYGMAPPPTPATGPVSAIQQLRRQPPPPAPVQAELVTQASSQPETPAAEAEVAAPSRGKHRGTTARLPKALVAAVRAEVERTGLTTWGVIAHAIEEALPELPQLLNPQATSRGLFSQAATAVRMVTDQPRIPLNFRPTVEDADALDRLVNELGAASMNHLVQIALAHHFKENT